MIRAPRLRPPASSRSGPPRALHSRRGRLPPICSTSQTRSAHHDRFAPTTTNPRPTHRPPVETSSHRLDGHHRRLRPPHRPRRPLPRPPRPLCLPLRHPTTSYDRRLTGRHRPSSPSVLHRQARLITSSIRLPSPQCRAMPRSLPALHTSITMPIMKKLPHPLDNAKQNIYSTNKRSASGGRAGTWADADPTRPCQDVIRGPRAHLGHPEPLPVAA